MDWFIILTPLLLLPIMALFCLVGCKESDDWSWGRRFDDDDNYGLKRFQVEDEDDLEYFRLGGGVASRLVVFDARFFKESLDDPNDDYVLRFSFFPPTEHTAEVISPLDLTIRDVPELEGAIRFQFEAFLEARSYGLVVADIYQRFGDQYTVTWSNQRDSTEDLQPAADPQEEILNPKYVTMNENGEIQYFADHGL